MAYPSRTDIVTAMRNPGVSFKAPELIGGSVIQSGSRIVQYSGGYTTVFPFHNKDGKKVAIRCWIADIGDAKKRSQEVSKHLDALQKSYFCDFKYLDDAILINGTIHPVVIMDWVEGQPLKEYINEHPWELSSILPVLAENFRQMTTYFHQQNIAHGDLQHGNILVKTDMSLVIIDYDSMYISSLDGMSDTIKGLPGYQHPARQNNKFISPKLDYFSELVIYLSLLVFADQPSLWHQFYETEDLLFSRNDFADPEYSELIKNLSMSPNPTVVQLTEKLKEQLRHSDLADLSPLETLMINKKEVSLERISEKWDNQPNAPTPKINKIPLPASITEKF